MITRLYLGRQPIIDREGRIVAYEILFRERTEGGARVKDSARATARVVEAILDLGVDRVTNHKLGFVNIGYDENLLKTLKILPCERIGFEVLESEEPTTDLLNLIREFKSMGYQISLDDFSYSKSYDEILKEVDYVKIDVVECNCMDKIAEIHEKVKSFGVKTIAEKVETYDMYSHCLSVGFDLFQGFFFQKPKVVEDRTIEPSYTTLMEIYRLVSQERSVKVIEECFKRHSELSLKLLQLINSAYYSLREPIKSIRHAILMLGYKNILRWVILLMYSLKGDSPQSDPLFEEASIRGFFMEELAKSLRAGEELKEKAFITGVLSLLDVLLETTMDRVVEGMALDTEIKGALTHRSGTLGELLSLVEAYEHGDHKTYEEISSHMNLTQEDLSRASAEAIKTYSDMIS